MQQARWEAAEGQDNPESRGEPIDGHDLFRALIIQELRGGRLNHARRRRVIRYAAHFGLTPEEVGRLVEECRLEAQAGQASPCRTAATGPARDLNTNSLPGRMAILAAALLLFLHLVQGWFE